MKQMHSKVKKIKGRGIQVYRMLMMISGFIFLWLGQMQVACATNYGEKAGTWILEQIFWIGLVFLGIALIGCLIKRAWVPALITGLCGGIILYFVKNPSQLSTIGENIANLIFT